MAKKGPEACMFCGAAPCECEGAAPKPKAKSKATTPKPKAKRGGKAEPAKPVAAKEAEPEGLAAVLPSRRGGPDSNAGKRSRKEVGRRRHHKASRRSVPEHRAIIAFAAEGLLSAETARKYSDTINPPLAGGLAASCSEGSWEGDGGEEFSEESLGAAGAATD